MGWSRHGPSELAIPARERMNRGALQGYPHGKIQRAKTPPPGKTRGRSEEPSSVGQGCADFEGLISTISARFINLPADQVDQEIDLALRLLLDYFQVDRVGFIRASQVNKTWRITHVASREGIPPVPLHTDLPISLYPWAYRKVFERHEILAFTSPDELPAEASIDRQTYREWGIRSNVNIPIVVAGADDYIMVANSLIEEHAWSEECFPRLRLVGELFVHALERQHMDRELAERLRFEELLSDLSAAFVNISPTAIDDEINRWLRRLAEFFRVDRCVYGEFSPDGTRITTFHVYARKGIPQPPPFVSIDRLPNFIGQTRQGLPVVIGSVADLPPSWTEEARYVQEQGLKSVLACPLLSDGQARGILSLVSLTRERKWADDLVQRCRLVTEVFANAMTRTRLQQMLLDSEGELQAKLREIDQLRRQLEHENIYLRQEANLLFDHGQIIGETDAIRGVLAQVELVAPSSATVLLLGETGTGKELVAQAIHTLSKRKHRVMVKVNCASLPAPLIESELFGRERGAYTGALTKQIGRFELADGSTIFLDEIAELPLELQAKLLRVLQDGEFERLGSPRTVRVDVRVIAATNRDLAEAVRSGTFREDLYYRLKVFPIEVPPLRERLNDIPLLVRSFVAEFGEKMGKKIQAVPRRTMEALQRYPWPGNVRELRNVIEQAVIITTGETLQVKIPHERAETAAGVLTLEETEYLHITGALERTGWRIKGRQGAAELLGLKPSTLYSRMSKLGIPTHRDKVDIPT